MDALCILYIYIYIYIYIHIYIQGGYAPFRRSWSSNNNNSEQGGVEDLGGRLLGSILECFEGV